MAASILQRIASGDNAAVDECITRYGGVVWALARRASPTRLDAEDAVQEIFLEVWQSAGRFNPAIASETSFIAMLARRKLIDRFRSGKRKMPMQSLESDPALPSGTGPDGVELCEEAARAREGLSRLRPEEKEILELSIEQGMSHSQIADRLQMALGTAKSHARRGLLRLRDYLGVSEASLEMEGRR